MHILLYKLFGITFILQIICFFLFKVDTKRRISLMIFGDVVF